MLTISGTTITLTRGDSASIKLTLTKKDDGTAYEPIEGDSIRFALSKQFGTESPLVLIDIPTDTLILEIMPEHTKSLAFGSYVYDLEITYADGRVETFVDKAKFVVDKEVY